MLCSIDITFKHELGGVDLGTGLLDEPRIIGRMAHLESSRIYSVFLNFQRP